MDAYFRPFDRLAWSDVTANGFAHSAASCLVKLPWGLEWVPLSGLSLEAEAGSDFILKAGLITYFHTCQFVVRLLWIIPAQASRIEHDVISVSGIRGGVFSSDRALVLLRSFFKEDKGGL